MTRARPPIVIAIPAMDEAERIVACLTALGRQEIPPDEVVLLCNNCTDKTEINARSLAPRLPFGLHVISREFPPDQANAGHARRLVMALAARRAGPHGVLMTSDADSMVQPDWIRLNLDGLLNGADLVCGCAVIDQTEAELIPAQLHADDGLERQLVALVDEMAWMIDPDPCDPLPRHTEASGASLAVWVSVFDRVGGIPAIPSGEDRAFVEALRQIDARIRHDPAIEVVVSGRITGRANGGMADAIRRRMVQQDEFTDAEVEPAEHALRRITLRSRARAAWSHAGCDHALAGSLGVTPKRLAAAMARPFFGAAWAEIEAASPLLVRQPVRFVDLPKEIATATRLLSAMPDTMAAD